MIEGPIYCNMNTYPVPIRTPDGKMFIVPTGAAVSGPGFETYADQHILFLVGSDFPGLIVYRTPPELVGKFQAQAIELEEIRLNRELKETKAELAQLREERGVSMELPPVVAGVGSMPLPEATEPRKEERAANNEKPKAVLPEKVTKDNIPSKSTIRNLSKTDLVKVCADLGWKNLENLSRQQLAARLLQIAKD